MLSVRSGLFLRLREICLSARPCGIVRDGLRTRTRNRRAHGIGGHLFFLLLSITGMPGVSVLVYLRMTYTLVGGIPRGRIEKVFKQKH
jgi:uncharacterized iron-regulated membrane protein